MRILIASMHRNLVGGVEKYLKAVIPALADRGHSIGLLHEYPCDWGVERIDPVNNDLLAWCAQEQGIPATLHEVEAWHPDIVYFQGLESLALEAPLLERYPTVFYAHNYYGTCVSGRKCHLVPQPRPCNRKMGLACLLLYYPRRCGGLHPGTMLHLYQQQLARQSWLPRFQAVLVASQHMFQEFERHGVPAGQLHLVPLPASEPDVGFVQSWPPLAGEHILFAGRLTDVKGGQFLVQAVKRAAQKLGRDLTLVVAGDGPEKESLQNLAHRLGLKAEFTGWVEGEQKLKLMRQAALVAVPSVWPEPFGLVGVEAAGFGIPAVAYAVGGIPDWLIPGESGELAPGDPPTIGGLADAIVRALSDPEHYRKLCAGARKSAARFNLHDHIARLEPILNSRSLPSSSAEPVPAHSNNRDF